MLIHQILLKKTDLAYLKFEVDKLISIVYNSFDQKTSGGGIKKETM